MRLLAKLTGLAAALLTTACAPTTTGESFDNYINQLVNNGKLRKERAPADAPFSNADLVRNFETIAFGLEPQLNGGVSEENHIRRWRQPIRYWLIMSESDAERTAREIHIFMDRLGDLTGVEIQPATEFSQSNFDVLVLGPDDYGKAEDRLYGADASLLRAFRWDSAPCQARVYHSEGFANQNDEPKGSITYAIVMIRAGLKPFFAKGCVEEELAQSMGLMNDDDHVRPSIFNDDEEFAFLTEHDEYLLRILYDPRLQPGQSRKDAMTLVPDIVETLRPGG
ncbi:MAG: DUF2927 domain-containing protein [Pseudomonadota bacterium]